jgi:hypothetical protein
MQRESSIESSISSKKSVPKVTETNTRADQDSDQKVRRNVIEKQKSPSKHFFQSFERHEHNIVGGSFKLRKK